MIDVVIDVWGVGCVGVYLVLCVDVYDMGDVNCAEIFGYVVRELGKCSIVFICVCEKEGDDSLML